MTVKRVVLDTNVLISYSLTPNGIAGKVSDFLIEQGLLLFSQETFAELETRLWRPKFDKYITLEQRKSILHDLDMIALWVKILTKKSYSRDPDDDKFIETAIVGKADCLISGDSDLLDLGTVEDIPILSPHQYWEKFYTNKR
jgi:putative PIN family toxin of toxin-antitoxin system